MEKRKEDEGKKKKKRRGQEKKAFFYSGPLGMMKKRFPLIGYTSLIEFLGPSAFVVSYASLSLSTSISEGSVYTRALKKTRGEKGEEEDTSSL